MELTLYYETHFDAAHYLPDYDGDCSRMHGHTYDVRVEVVGHLMPSGFVVDLAVLKKVIKTILDQLDHQITNDLLEQPTVEHITIYIMNGLVKLLPEECAARVNRVEVSEGKNKGAILTYEQWSGGFHAQSL